MRPGRPSRTAQHNALFRAIEARRPAAERVVDDRLAVRFLPPEFRAVAELARVPPVRRMVEKVIDERWPGPRPGVVVRTRLLDDAVSEALHDVHQVLVLGAGFDTRAYRLPGIEEVRVFEVDHPSTQARKERALGRIPPHVTFVPVKFGRDDLVGALAEAGFESGPRTLVLWEGVTNYLTAEAVDGTFRSIASLAGPGSIVLWTYIDRGVLDASEAFDGASESSEHVARVGEPYTFGFDPCDVPAYLEDRGFRLAWDVTVPEAATRYLPNPHLGGYGYYHVAEAQRV